MRVIFKNECPKLKSLFACWFYDSSESDEEIITEFVAVSDEEELNIILSEASKILKLKELPWDAMTDVANRYFETEKETRVWFEKILALIKTEYAKQHGKKDLK